jgi:Ca2+/Na+ antiporter
MSNDYESGNPSVASSTIGSNVLGSLAVISSLAVVSGLLLLTNQAIATVVLLFVSLLVFTLCWKILRVVRELNARVQRLEQQLED